MRHIGSGSAAITIAVLIVGAACGGEDLGQRQSTQLVRSTPTANTEPAPEATTTAAPSSGTEAPSGDALEAEIVGFELPDLEIEVGTTVNWVNRDPAGHTATSGTPEEPTELFDTGILIADKTAGFTFDEEGTFLYYCRVHPASMRSTITVVAPGGAVEVAEPEPEPASTPTATAEPATPSTVPTATPEPPTATPAAEPTATPTPTPEPILRNSNIKASTLENFVVEVGTTVAWTNLDPVPHTSTSGTPTERTGDWDSLTLNKDDGFSFTFTFTEEGEFAYFCKVHPSFMRATVTVVGRGELDTSQGEIEQPTATSDTTEEEYLQY